MFKVIMLISWTISPCIHIFISEFEWLRFSSSIPQFDFKPGGGAVVQLKNEFRVVGCSQVWERRHDVCSVECFIDVDKVLKSITERKGTSMSTFHNKTVLLRMNEKMVVFVTAT